MRLFVTLILLSASIGASAQFVDVGVVALSSQFDALPGPDDRVHLLGRRYKQLAVDGEELVDEAQGAALPGGPFGFPPALSVAPDGSVHTVTRVGGDFSSGHRLRYRRRNTAGAWDRDYEFSTPSERNYVVSVAALGDEVVLTSSEVDSGVFGSLRVWSALESSARAEGRIASVWRADDGTRLRASSTRLFLAVGLPNPAGQATVMSATSAAALADAPRSAHTSGSDRRGVPDLYVDSLGRAHLIYGASQEVYYNVYAADGTRGTDVRVGESLGPWRLNIGMGAVAGEGDDVLVLLLRPGGNLGENSQVVWRRSTDGGATWTAPEELGVTTDATEGRVRPRAMYVDGNFVALVAASDGIRMYTLEIDPDGDGDGFRASEDCDDVDPTSNPGAAEVCDDAADNDCDGDTDGDDTDCAAMPDMGVVDAGVPDSGAGMGVSDTGPPDTGTEGDTGPSDGGSDGGPGAISSGCSCSATGTGRGRTGALFAVLALTGVTLRRRRRD